MKKICTVCILCCLLSGTAYAKDAYYENITDSTSGRQIEYFDLGGDDTERMYFTQSAWTKDSNAYAVSDIAEKKMYLYKLSDHSITALHGDSIRCNDVAITKDNIMYMRDTVESGSGHLYKIDLNSVLANTDEVSAEVNADGTGFDGELTLRRWYRPSEWSINDSYDRCIVFSGEDSNKSAVEGKQYSFNEAKTDSSSWKRWRNSWHFDVPDNFLYGNNYDTVEIEVEYYAPNPNGAYLNLFVNSDSCSYQSGALAANVWTTKVFKITKNDGKNATFSNGWSSSDAGGYSDFRLMTQGGADNGGCQLYIHKVTVRKLNDNIVDLGERPSAYLIHTSDDGKFLSLSGTDPNGGHITIYDADNNTWGRMSKWFNQAYTTANHVMINPVYTDLVLFAHDSTSSSVEARDVFDRMWIFNRNDASFANVFKQYSNMAGIYTGEAVGHENWTADGESIVAVKYRKNTNVGKNGIIRFDKYGNNREYLNDDYDYWHCAPSPDGRWIVADTLISGGNKTKIVMIDSKTGNSYVIAEQKADNNDPGQPHPQFSRDGTKVTFGMRLENRDVLGVGIVDVSDLINDDQIEDVVYAEANGKKGFHISPFSIDFGGASSGKVSTYIENLDGKTKKITLYVGVYDTNGILTSVSANNYNSTESSILSTSFSWPDGSKFIKCFLWSDDNEPINTTPTGIENLRVAKTGMNTMTLSWKPSNSMIDINYEIYRNGVKIGETSDLVYRDSGLNKNTTYTYEVKPIFNKNVYITENNSIVVARPAVSYLGNPIVNYGINFLENNYCSMDSYTQNAVIGGEPCRKAIHVSQGQTIDGVTRTKWGYDGMYYFVCDRDIIDSNDSNVTIGVRYFDIGTNDINIEYNATDGSSGKSVFLVKRTNTNTWKTATVSITDAEFIANSTLTNCDFRVVGGNDTYINMVWAVPTSEIDEWATPSYISGTTGPAAGLKATTKNNVLTSNISSFAESGLSFILNDSDTTVDTYTEATDKGSGTWGRQSTSKSPEVGKFYFRVDNGIISKDDHNLTITVKYFKYNSNGGSLYFDYVGSDGQVKSVKLADFKTLKYGNQEWATVTKSITDAGLIEKADWHNCEIRIRPTRSGSCISEVRIENTSTSTASPYQSVQWNTNVQNGLTLLGGGTISDNCRYLSSSSEWLTFDVDNTYQYSSQMNMAWIDISYLDLGTGEIYLEYNTSDPTATSAQRSHKRAEAITLTNTGEIKTKRIALIDVDFMGYDGYDFRIGTNSSAYISGVKVLGY